jgi:hypothetical protein
MSFASREKRRKTQIGSAVAAKNRRRHPERWYLTIMSRNGCCNDCGGYLREGADVVYRHTPREILCRVCADLRGIAPRPSLRWEKTRRRRAT